MLGFVTSSRVTSANSTAAAIKKQIDNFLTDADTAGYGMKQSSSATANITFKVDADGKWDTAITTGAYTPGTVDLSTITLYPFIALAISSATPRTYCKSAEPSSP